MWWEWGEGGARNKAQGPGNGSEWLTNFTLLLYKSFPHSIPSENSRELG